MFTDVTNILFVYYQGQKTMYHKNMFGNGSTYYNMSYLINYITMFVKQKPWHVATVMEPTCCVSSKI